MFRIRRALEGDVGAISPRLRESDVRELAALSPETPHNILWSSYRKSSECYTTLVDENPEAMFGVGPHPENTSFGIVWLLSTPILMDRVFQFVRESREFIHRFNTKYPVIGNLVDSENTKSTKWLERMGFAPVESKVIGGRDFYFYVRRSSGEPRDCRV